MSFPKETKLLDITLLKSLFKSILVFTCISRYLSYLYISSKILDI
nr:MAG TPA: hypothetical protein [Bacteriophage sp.]